MAKDKERVTKYTDLKERVDTAQRKADKAEGELEAQMDRLREEYECDSLEEANKKLKSLEKEEAKLIKKRDKAINDFEEKWCDNND